jgi:frataxin-like iron-binding protein CyaY
MNKNVYVLYDSTDDSVVCNLSNEKTMLFNSRKSALEEWIGYPEQVKHFNRLPLHWQKTIINEQNTLTA